MTLNVDPEALRSYGFLLRRALDDAQECKAYFHARVADITPGVEGGLINPIGYAHFGVRQELGALLDRLVDILEDSQQSLFNAAAHYERTDSDSAKRLDDSLPAVHRPIPAVS
ncbi:hypothetical protein [Actinoplanes sp. GCM10030250]|uniref:hypothetical protein n=1 Tax=Actinoplanes sp. GCM10030250 TaxID=3273376 RepID=UPI0036244F67